jgi:hypothetical protein
MNRKPNAYVPNFDHLEIRQLLSVTPVAANFDKATHVLTIQGTEKADSIYIEQSSRTNKVYVGSKPNGSEYGVFDGNAIQRIVVYGAGDNDVITLNYYNSVTRETNPVRIPATISGGGGHDAITGETRDDHIDGGAGNDIIYGGEGNDLIAGQEGVDTIYGDGGNDVIYGGAGGNNTEAGGADTDYLYGGKGNDSLWGGGGNDYIWGDDNDDALFGGSGNDFLMGGAGADRLFGNTGVDRLFGESSSAGGSTSWDRNWLEAGSPFDLNDAASETALDGWNALKPVVGGTTFTDVDQESSSTCILLASIASALKQGMDLSNRVQYLGNYTYRVSFEGGKKFQNVLFDGTIFNNAKGDRLDPGAAAPGESWVIIYQRAYLKAYFNIDAWNTKAVDEFSGEENCVQAYKAIGLSKVDNKEYAKGFTSDVADALKKLLDAKNAVAVGGPGHRYALFDVVKDAKGNVTVELYNPWGSSKVTDKTVDGKKMQFVAGSKSGIIKVTWSEFTKFFSEYSYGKV